MSGQALAVQRIGDAGITPYTLPVASSYTLDGVFVAVGGTGSRSSTGLQWISEL